MATAENEQPGEEAPMTVGQAVKALVQNVVTDENSVLAVLGDRVEDAIERLDRAARDALAALPVGACEHDAQWIDDLAGIADDLSTAMSYARSEADEAVADLRAAMDRQGGSRP